MMETSAHHPFRSVASKGKYLAHYGMRAKRWPIDSESRLVETSWGQTFVRISGSPDARPLVMLPGAGGNSLMWVANIEALSEHFQTYAIDAIYDYGKSVSMRAMKNSDDLACWLEELMDALKLEDNINLLGMSYGGWVASQCVLHFQERLRKVVLMAPGGLVPMRLWFILRSLPSALLPYPYFMKDFMYWLFEDLAKKDAASQMLVESVADDLLIGAQCFKPRHFVFPAVLGDEAWRSIKVPVLYIIGKNEKIYSVDRAVQRLNNVAPHVKIALIPNAGHDLNLVQADRVNKVILEFFDEHN